MTQLAVSRPFNETDLHDDLGMHPMRAHSRQPDGFGKWRFSYFDRVKAGTQLQQQLVVEAGSDLSREDQVIIFRSTRRAKLRDRRVRLVDP
jgi:hypothetical protein